MRPAVFEPGPPGDMRKPNGSCGENCHGYFVLIEAPSRGSGFKVQSPLKTGCLAQRRICLPGK